MTARMEAPFYDDSAPGFSQPPDYERYPANKMLPGKKAVAGGHHFLGGGRGGGTMAADMNLLKLSSPDLEHLIIQSSPGGPAPSPFVYRPPATNEQEGFADGFVKALADLHKQNQLVGGGPMSPSSSYQRGLMGGGDAPVYTNLGSYGSAQIPYAGGPVNYGGGSAHAPPPHPRVLDAPQTVPEVPHPPGDPASPPSLSPIDLETQERIKAERKKLRNRIAASKCRKRKLERISRLEEKVKALKGQNAELASTAAALRQQVAQLRHKVMSHVTNGCHIAVGAKPGARDAANAAVCSEDPSC